jgi:hypothetical protein
MAENDIIRPHWRIPALAEVSVSPGWLILGGVRIPMEK